MAPSALAALLFVEAPIAPSELHLYVRNDHDPARTAAAAELFVDDLRGPRSGAPGAPGAPGTSYPYDTLYGMREAVHVDLDNNLIRFGSPLGRA
jgi:hypothetical protein